MWVSRNKAYLLRMRLCKILYLWKRNIRLSAPLKNHCHKIHSLLMHVKNMDFNFCIIYVKMNLIKCNRIFCAFWTFVLRSWTSTRRDWFVKVDTCLQFIRDARRKEQFSESENKLSWPESLLWMSLARKSHTLLRLYSGTSESAMILMITIT